MAAISIPVFSSQLEKSREATDLANVRAAYAQIMAEVIGTENNPEPIPVKLKQKQYDWQTGLPITIGGIIFHGTGNDNWIGSPDANGICMVSYEKDYGVIFNWNGGYSGTIAFSKDKFLNYTIPCKVREIWIRRQPISQIRPSELARKRLRFASTMRENHTLNPNRALTRSLQARSSASRADSYRSIPVCHQTHTPNSRTCQLGVSENPGFPDPRDGIVQTTPSSVRG